VGAKPVRVVVVDDSLVAREMLCQILGSDPGIEVVATAKDGAAGVELVASMAPDLVTMDIHMPRMDGLEAVERIMAFNPTPILVVSSSVHGEGIGRAFDALGAGALEVVKKPEPADWAELERIGRDLIRKVKMLSKVKVITHVRGRRTRDAGAGTVTSSKRPRDGFSLVAIGSSTGGPSALQKVLEPLPADLPVPVVIAQHIAEGFIPGLVGWLDGLCAVTVRVAEDGDHLQPGNVYVAPTGSNLELEDDTCRIRPPDARQLYIPSADNLFASVARSHGSHAVGVILTGMGADGAEGLKAMRAAGAITIAQDEQTSVVFGMPKAAIENGAAQHVLPLERISGSVLGFLRPQEPRSSRG
jgi:two-component system chemotaxis response regulator CheB